MNSIFGPGYIPFMVCKVEQAESLEGHWRGIAEVYGVSGAVLGIFVHMSRASYFKHDSEELFDKLLAFEYLTITSELSNFYFDKVRQSIKDPINTVFSYKLVD